MHLSGRKVGGWDDVVIRIIAFYKLVKAVLALTVAVYIFHLIRVQEPDVLKTMVETLHINLESGIMRWVLENMAPIINQHIHSVDIIILVYAGIFLAEGIGLFLRETWAEYLVIVSTSIPLPLEIYEVFTKIALWNVAILLANIFVLTYLIHRLYVVHQLVKAEKKAALKSQPSTPELSQV